MDMYRAFLAILISFVILLGYQYFFIGPIEPEPAQTVTEQPAAPQQPAASQPAVEPQITAPAAQQQSAPVAPQPAPVDQRPARGITVDTDLYTATMNEKGGVLTGFVLKDYRQSIDKDAPGVDLVKTDMNQGYPLSFSFSGIVDQNTLYTLDSTDAPFDKASGIATVTMRATTQAGLEVVRSYEFNRSNYLIKHRVTVVNNSGQVLQGSAGLHQKNLPFSALTKASSWLFRGPALYSEAGLQQFKLKEFEDGPQTVQGSYDWIAYEGTYFLTAVMPGPEPVSVTMNAQQELVSIDILRAVETLAPGAQNTYDYQLYFGPKKIGVLKEIGSNLGKALNFGWFDIIARPMLYLLNWFHSVVRNYGVAIILVTILLKACFWPITQKGLKSMKNMQKLQPKVVKLKEKYKNDPTRMNQEMMNLYKTYKVNPLGGCLPMVLQIPVFFSLYRVLLQSIELRHAPFMLWINDLSAPDRLYLGFDLPYLGGLPVLTLLMGASMFLQQKMTPTTADPTQQRIMMFLPLIFTVMFVNFASGLVLYWFVNNLLSILQQYLINRQKKPAKAA
ncbi:MAG: membrane protein insertase YidC [Desulfofustis sp.]|jgi:YidC/Oxa1 family membrane protein insertase|nr:membrane protein insertase YidC [Desulfofustis sp.]